MADLAKALGISQGDLDRLWQDAKANQARLAQCQKHDFSTDTTPDRSLGKRWACTACGGVVEAEAKRWYVLGLAHAGR